MTKGERLQLLRELLEIQTEIPEVVILIDHASEAVTLGQDRVKEIESMLATDTATRVAKADLGP